MSEQSRTYTLDTGKRVFTASFTEYHDRVVMSLRATRYGDLGDMARMAEWLMPLLERYDSDERPMQIRNQHTGERALIFDAGMLVFREGA